MLIDILVMVMFIDFELEKNSPLDGAGAGPSMASDTPRGAARVRLLDELKALVAKNAPGWEIHLRSDNFDYGIFIGPTEIRLQRNNQELLKQLFQ